MSPFFRSILFLTLSGWAGVVLAQPITCVTSAVPPIVRAEGLAERIGDIEIDCTDSPNDTLTLNFAVLTNTTISNRLSAGNTLTGIVFTEDSGTGPQAVTVQPILINSNTLAFNGVPVTFSPQGAVSLRIVDIRVNATAIPVGSAIIASVSLNIPVNMPQIVVGTPETGLAAAFSSSLVCAQNGSPLPSTINFANLIQTGTSLSSIRMTEGFADSFQPLSSIANLNADSGERFIITYSGFPQDATLYVPDVIAGSDAIQPTGGGDLELPASGGAYAPLASGSLLLARVAGAGTNGAGGSPIYTPGAIGSGTVTFNTVSPLGIVNGSAYVVYEVVDANNSVVESAQFPTFLGLAPNGNRPASQTSASVTFAPVSKIGVASATEPLPRFAAVTPPVDCSIVGDCATYLPSLSIATTSIQLSAPEGGALQEGYFVVQNTGGGDMNWQISVSYGSGSGWLTVTPTQGINQTTVVTYANPSGISPGTYTATLIVNGGQYAGTQTVTVTFVVTAPPAPPAPSISSVVNAASFAAVPAVPGSLSTVMGTNFTGSNITASFNGVSAPISFSNGTQINLLVPAALAGQTTSQLVVTVNGRGSKPDTVNLAPFAPAIFSGGVINQDWTLNSATNGASAGSVLQIYATGLSSAGTITGQFSNQVVVPDYAGAAPGFAGVQQVNLTIPVNLAATTANLYVCGAAQGAAAVCSVPVPVTIK
ncbi:MAG TPA: IPT/TIG domain-containing protein [Bryobacteraceae bacterium]